jgi:hypothetical protein
MKGQRTQGRYGVATNKSIKCNPNFLYDNGFYESLSIRGLGIPITHQVSSAPAQPHRRGLCPKCIIEKQRQRANFNAAIEKEKLLAALEKRKYYDNGQKFKYLVSSRCAEC